MVGKFLFLSRSVLFPLFGCGTNSPQQLDDPPKIPCLAWGSVFRQPNQLCLAFPTCITLARIPHSASHLKRIILRPGASFAISNGGLSGAMRRVSHKCLRSACGKNIFLFLSPPHWSNVPPRAPLQRHASFGGKQMQKTMRKITKLQTPKRSINA